MSTTETAPPAPARAIGVAEGLQYILDRLAELEQRLAALEAKS